MKLRAVEPGEMRDDPHAGIKDRIAKLRQRLADMKLCNHRPLKVVGCRGCEAWNDPA